MEPEKEGGTSVRGFTYMLAFVPLAVVARFVLPDLPVLLFVLCGLALIALAAQLGAATEQLAIDTGPRIGGVIQATLSNTAELIIAAVALKAGHHELVKASITGSIIGNVLLVLGASLLCGGLRNGTQRYDRDLTSIAGSMMLLAVSGLIIPTLFEVLKEVASATTRVDIFNTTINDPELKAISLGVAAILITVYMLSMIYLLGRGPREAAPGGGEPAAGPGPEAHLAKWNIKTSLAVLTAATLGVVLMSEFLVGTIEPVAHSLGLR